MHIYAPLKIETQCSEHKMSSSDNIQNAVNHMMQRDEDGNFLNQGLNELESNLFVKLQNDKVNSSVGESVMSAYRKELLFALNDAIAKVANDFGVK